MKRLRIKYTPPVVQGVALIILIAAAIGAAQFVGEIALYIGILFAMMVYAAMYSFGSVVEFGKEKVIKCKCLFFIWKIDLDKIDAFSYSIESHNAKGGPRFSFDVRFHFSRNGIDDYYVLKKNIYHEDIIKFMNGELDRIDLMKIYRYAQSVYPEKAKGYMQADCFQC